MQQHKNIFIRCQIYFNSGVYKIETVFCETEPHVTYFVDIGCCLVLTHPTP